MAVDHTFLEEIVNACIHRNHVLGSGGVDDTADLMRFALTYQVTDRRGQYHDLYS